MRDVATALVALKRRQPALRRAVVKLEEGASGEGNALFEYDDAPGGALLDSWVEHELPSRLRPEAPDMSYEQYAHKFGRMGGIVESWIEGTDKRSPSVQLRINPLSVIETISTHEQLLGGVTGQRYLGACFPAAEDYRRAIDESARRAAQVLRDRGVLGRFGIDFVCVRSGDSWHHYAIEINLRKGGTTHTFQTLQYLTGGRYDVDTGRFLTPQGECRYYWATDNLVNPLYRRLTPPDLIDVSIEQGLHFDRSTQQGVTFNLIGAVSEFGKLGMVSIAASPAAAEALHRRAVHAIETACTEPVQARG